MYLSRLHLDIRNIYARKCLHDCQIMHRSIQSMFHSGRQESGVLYRLNPNSLHVYVWSVEEPDSGAVPKGMDGLVCKDFSEVENKLQEGNCYRFNLLAYPSKKVESEGKKNSQRRFLASFEERSDWLSRKGLQNGFSVLQVQEENEYKSNGRHDKEDKRGIFYRGVVFQGILRVDNLELFKNCWRNGIGPGKAYGQGMMLLQHI